GWVSDRGGRKGATAGDCQRGAQAGSVVEGGGNSGASGEAAGDCLGLAQGLNLGNSCPRFVVLHRSKTTGRCHDTFQTFVDKEFKGTAGMVFALRHLPAGAHPNPME